MLLGAAITFLALLSLYIIWNYDTGFLGGFISGILLGIGIGLLVTYKKQE